MREGFEVYEALLDAQREAVLAGQEVVLEVRDFSEFVRKIVRARVARSPEELPGSRPLWVRGYKEVMLPDPLAIEILEELDEEQVTIEYPEPQEERVGLYGCLMDEVKAKELAQRRKGA